MDTKSEYAQLDLRDLEYVLNAYTKTFMFYNRGAVPTKIVLPKINKFVYTVDRLGPVVVTIPVEYVDVEVPEPQEVLEQEEEAEPNDDASRHQRASGDSDPDESDAGDDEDSTEHTEEV